MSAEVINLDEFRPISEGSFYNSDHRANVVEFHQRLARCSICSSPHHRASHCPLRPRTATRKAPSHDAD